MPHSDGPPNGSDHPPQNGHRAKQVAIALFVATTFGTMAILSFPVFRARGPLRPRVAALPGGNTPSERPIRPILPSIEPPSRPRSPGTSVALGPRNLGTLVNQVPLGPGGPGPGGPGPGGPPPGQPPPPGENPPAPPPTTPSWAVVFRTTLLNLATTLSHRTTLSPEEALRIRAILALPRDLRKACKADRACARELKVVRKLLQRLAPGVKGAHGHGRHHHSDEGTSGSEGVLPERKHGHGHGRGESDDRNRGSGSRKGKRSHHSSHSHRKHGHGNHKD